MKNHKYSKHRTNLKIIEIIQNSELSELDKATAIKHILKIAKSDARCSYCKFKYNADKISNLFVWYLVNPGYEYWYTLAVQLGETEFTNQLTNT